jgi:conjugal transfer pilus assembly protein TraI
VQSYLDYPSKPAGITLFSEREILSVHANRLQEINMYIGLPNSDLSEEAYTFTNLVIKPLMNIHVGYIFYLRLKTITMPVQGVC